jgi:hypothetical protein
MEGHDAQRHMVAHRFILGYHAMMKRMPDGTAWVVLMNSSGWNGPN